MGKAEGSFVDYLVQEPPRTDSVSRRPCFLMAFQEIVCKSDLNLLYLAEVGLGKGVQKLKFVFEYSPTRIHVLTFTI
jgi:hypothetical protein